MFSRHLLAGFSALVLFAPAALAQTPDEQPPSEESVCDPLKGRTPGLWGLCNAYCEAIDCVGEQGDPWQCSSILNNYNHLRKTGIDADPIMPCLPPCPCFDDAFIAIELETVRTCGESRAAGVDANVCSASVSVSSGTSCNRANRNLNALGGCSLVSLVSHPLTEAQALVCEALIDTVCP